MASVRILIFHGYLLRGHRLQRLQRAAGRRRWRAPGPRGRTCSARSAGPRTLDASTPRRLGRRRGCASRAPRGRARDDLPARHRPVCCPSTSPTATRASRPRRSPSSTTRRSPTTWTRNVARRRARSPSARAPDVALANHLVMGPLILARGAAGDVPYAVKVHGSALEYAVKPEPERFLPAAREGLARARDGARRLAPHGRERSGRRWTTRRCRRARGSGRPASTSRRFAPAPRAEAAALHALAAGLAEQRWPRRRRPTQPTRRPRSPATPPRRPRRCAPRPASATASWRSSAS